MKLHHTIAIIAVALLPAACGPRVKLANSITSAEAQQLAAAGPPEVREVHFGNKFTLLGANGRSSGDGLVLELAWKTNGKQKLEYLVPIHVLDAAGKIVGQADYRQDEQRREVAGDTIWRDEVAIPRETLAGAASIGIGLMGDGQKWLPPDRGPRDQDVLRLLFPVPPELSKPAAATPFDGFLEAVNNSEIVGWVWQKSEPAKAIEVEIFDGENRLDKVKADVVRDDLAKAGVGDGKHGFRLAMPEGLKDGKPHRIAVRVVGAEFELHKSPKTFTSKK